VGRPSRKVGTVNSLPAPFPKICAPTHPRPDCRIPERVNPKSSVPWHVPLLLSLPAFFPLAYACISAWAKGLVPTGFIQYDLAYYVANARQHFDEGFRLTYGNPYAPYGTPAIYFQPHIFLLGILQKIGFAPAVAFNLFGVAAVAFAAIAAARLYDEVIGWRTTAQKLGLICFFWGGGVLSLFGLAFGLFSGTPVAKASLMFDPTDGWWLLNFGRNLVYPTEAYYHGVFLLAILMLIRERRGAALALSALLSASHPFSGLSLALVFTAYAAIETILKSGAASARFLAGSAGIVICHLVYYQVFLNHFADHRLLRAQWELDWPYVFWTALPALYLVGVLAFVRLSRWKTLQPALGDPRMRLFMVLLIVILGLSHHDLLIKPVQQIHFVHGYDLIALFFLGAPGLLRMLDRVLAVPSRVWRTAAVALFLLVMTSDNLFWFASFRDASVQRYAITIDPDERDALRWLGQHARPPAIVASTSGHINYLTSTYTPVRSWFGHDYNTPHAAERREEVQRVFDTGTPLTIPNPVYYVPRRDLAWTPPAGAQEVYENAGYHIWLSLPTNDVLGRR
jgi:hypothetical protein